LWCVVVNNLVIDFATANAALPTQVAAVASPTDMKDLIGRYDYRFRERILEIASTVSTTQVSNHAGYVHQLENLKVLPPIIYPTTIMNAALNYTEHALEMKDVQDAGGDAATPPGLAPPGTYVPPGIWEPAADEKRWNPYMFLKSPSAVIAHNVAILHL